MNNLGQTARHHCISVAILILMATAGFICHAGSIPVQHGDISLGLDEQSGALISFAYKGETILSSGAERSPVTCCIGEKDKNKWLESFGKRRVTNRTQPAPDTVELTVRIGDFELVERYRIHTSPARLDRSVTLINRGTETVKLRAFAFKTFGVIATKDGFYRFPRQWPPRSHAFSGMKQGTTHGGGGSIAPLLAELSQSRSLLWLSFGTDPSSIRVEENEGRFDVVQNMQAAGYLKPNQPQEIGFASMQISDTGYWGTLPLIWRWMDNVGLKVPADRPKWIEEAILYCFHPGGTIGSNFKDLGGFRPATEQLLPTIPDLGATAIWIMPIEQRSPYWPFDYYKFMDGLGTADDYKALVKRAHDLNLHVLQDLVPHGGSPKAVHNLAHPEFMLHREDGSILNYWLNDFAWPDWQKYIAGVASYYCREYGVDGYRVDACSGSKEMNWNPEIPYARASHALLWGGIGMMKGIRTAVREAKPKDGAILAEAEASRLLSVADAQYDFGFCYNLCHQWRRESPEYFVTHLQEYLEEQKYIEPRGTLRMRHVESHDSLRSEMWYGVDGMHAMYALSAWIDGIPLIYQGMEDGHAAALKQINEIRKNRPELARGEAFYQAVKCNAPGVFTCLRKLGDKKCVVAINFNREAVKAKLAWSDGKAELELNPLEYAVVPGTNDAVKPSKTPSSQGELFSGNEIVFPEATEWFAETISGQLRDQNLLRSSTSNTEYRSSIYWRPKKTDILWRNELMPLHPARPMLGVKNKDGKWKVLYFQENIPDNVQLIRNHEKGSEFRLTGLGNTKVRILDNSEPHSGPVQPAQISAVTFHCIGPDTIVRNKHYTVVLRRQGGVIRELTVNGRIVVKNHDMYGDQEYMQAADDDRISVNNDVECALRIEKQNNDLKLSFEGQLRGFGRFALKRPPILFRNEYVFNDAPSFHQKWAFCTEKTFKEKTAFLATILSPDADHFHFTRGNEKICEDAVGQSSARCGQTKGKPAPDSVEFTTGATRQLCLKGLRVPEGSDCNLFISGNTFFITLLDGKGSSMEQGRWYEFEADWFTY